MRRSPDPASSSSTSASRPRPEPLGEGAFDASAETSEALERNRAGPISLPEYACFLKQFHWTVEQLRSIPLSSGERFTLD
ncbi:MAG: hypothetical protein ABIT01_15200 [Thermoanaerobaculia bacterium]